MDTKTNYVSLGHVACVANIHNIPSLRDHLFELTPAELFGAACAPVEGQGLGYVELIEVKRLDIRNLPGCYGGQVTV